jgi:hypothetical protein
MYGHTEWALIHIRISQGWKLSLRVRKSDARPIQLRAAGVSNVSLRSDCLR